MKPLMIALFVAAAVLSGCGSKDADTVTTTITQPPVTVTNTPTSTVEVSPTETSVVQPTDTVTAPTQTVTETP
jgi:type IV pilus biogenesis protein CpaD/CtpE